MDRNRGFTRADLAAVVAVFLLLAMLMPPLLVRANKVEDEKKCAKNLRAIAQSMIVYSNENSDMYPILPATSGVKYDATCKPSPGKDTDDAALDAMYTDKSLVNNTQASLWILAIRNQVAPKDFLCPSDPAQGKPSEMKKDQTLFQNFQDGKSLSYSMAYPWMESKDGKVVVGQWWRNTTDSSLAILSDMAPYMSKKAGKDEATSRPAAKEGEKADPENFKFALSVNHGGSGMNVGFADAHTEFVKRADIGQANDNIITETVDKKEVAIDAGELPAKLVNTSPPFDIVMVPMRDAKGELK